MTRVSLHFPTGVVIVTDVLVVPRVGEHVVDNHTGKELRVYRVVHRTPDQHTEASVKICLSLG